MQGLARDELFDCSSLVEEAADFFYGNPDYIDLPRKHKITISSCAHACNAPEINCIALVGALHDDEPGFRVRVGGGLSSVPRISQDMGVHIAPEQAVDVLCAITDAWKADLRYRVSRVKARLKFMVDDIGPDGMRERVEALLGYELTEAPEPPAPVSTDHMGIHEQKQAGLSYIGVPVDLGLVSGEQLIGVADIADALEADVRITRKQNFILANVPTDRVPDAVARLKKAGFSPELNTVRAKGVACTGEPHCNFSVTETKTRLGALIDALEARFGHEIADLGLQLDGCPHACAQHWIADIGFQGTTVRDPEGKRQQAYDIFLRGGLGPDAAIGKPLFRRVPTAELTDAVGGLVEGWIRQREGEEAFSSFARRLDDEELGALAGLEPAKTRSRKDNA